MKMMKFQNAQVSQTNELKTMFQEIFDEEQEIVNLFFLTKFKPETTYIALDDNKITAMLYMIPTQIVTPQGIVKCNYLYGAGTVKKYRKKGIMEELIKFAIDKEETKSVNYTALLPATSSLYKYYGKIGFKSIFYVKKITYKINDNKWENKRNLSINNYLFDNMAQLRFNICKDKLGTVLWLENHIKTSSKYSSLNGGNLLLASDGYVLCSAVKNSSVNVEEIMVKNEKYLSTISALFYTLNVKTINVFAPIWLTKEGTVQPQGMLYCKKDNLEWAKNAAPYLGLTMN